MKKLKDLLDVTTNVVAIGVWAKGYFAPRGAKNHAVVQKGSAFPEIAGAITSNLRGPSSSRSTTSQRDASGRQVVDVYDERLKHVGTDLKFMNPAGVTTSSENRKSTRLTTASGRRRARLYGLSAGGPRRAAGTESLWSLALTTLAE